MRRHCASDSPATTKHPPSILQLVFGCPRTAPATNFEHRNRVVSFSSSTVETGWRFFNLEYDEVETLISYFEVFLNRTRGVNSLLKTFVFESPPRICGAAKEM